jgi:hypothetical protein
MCGWVSWEKMTAERSMEDDRQVCMPWFQRRQEEIS